MIRNALSAAALAIVMTISGCFAGPSQGDDGETPAPAMPGSPGLPNPPNITLLPVAQGLSEALFVTHAGDGSGLMYVVEQAGRVLVLQDGAASPNPFLDIRDRIGSSASEQGLLGLAFAPDYKATGIFYVDYTNSDGNTVVSRFHRSPADPTAGDPLSEQILLTVDQPFSNHNGGMLAFGPDGYLYVALGDGGLANDPAGHGQNPATLLGSMLRLDVAGTGAYSIPPDNPFVGGPQREEIWAWGLRNPWRFSFDKDTGDLYMGDVGQDAVEEINYQAATSSGGENYGWAVYEGSRSNRPGVPLGGTTFPVAEYEHAGRHCSVTGGYVYRGALEPDLTGTYLFGDFCSGDLWGMRNSESGWKVSLLAQTTRPIASFGEDEAGEVYVLDYTGKLLRVAVA